MKKIIYIVLTLVVIFIIGYSIYSLIMIHKSPYDSGLKKAQVLFSKNNLSMEELEFVELNYNRHGIGVTAAYFEQYVNGLKVYPDRIYYYFQNQKYVGTSKNRTTNISVDSIPKLSKEDAQKIVENQLPIIFDGRVNMTSIKEYEIDLIYYVDYGDGKTRTYSLAYLVKPAGIKNLNPLIVDANNGNILDNGIKFRD